MSFAQMDFFAEFDSPGHTKDSKTAVTAAPVVKLDVPERAAQAVALLAVSSSDGNVVGQPSAVSRPTASRPAIAIADAGEELVYNRRNRSNVGKTWGDVAHLNNALKIKEVVKTKVWPKPDYAQLIADGMPPIVAHIVKQVYDSVAAKPSIGNRAVLDDQVLQTYINGLNRVEQGLMEWAKDRNALRAWAYANSRVAGAMLGTQVGLSDLNNDRAWTLLNRVYGDGIRNNRTEINLIGGNKLAGALAPEYDDINRAVKAVRNSWPAKREAWEVQGFYILENPAVKLIANTDTRRTDVAGFLCVNDSYVLSYTSEAEGQALVAEIKPWALFGRRGFVASFVTEEDAVEGAKERTRREKSETISDKGTSVVRVERVGVARRLEEEDISSERMVAEFGFKGVNFGNWMKTPAARAEAQLHLNYAFDSFHDLAEILGVPPNALSLDGMLGVAIGAQGSGSFAAAHFVPGVNEINLTRTSGAGALAHEWGHALDHYFARMAGLDQTASPYLSEYVENHAKLTTGIKGLRPEIGNAFKVITEAMAHRLETEDEIRASLILRRDDMFKKLSGWVKSVRRDFSGYEESFSRLEKRILALDVGEGLVPISRKFHVSPVLIEVRDLYKSIHKNVIPIDHLKGVQYYIDRLMYAEAVIQRNAEKLRDPQMVASNFTTTAIELDKGKGGKPYWATVREKFARAFDAFITDDLEDRAAKNGYLSHSDRTGNTVPQGLERTAINQAFKGLIDTVQTKVMDENTILFSRGAPAGQAIGLDAATQDGGHGNPLLSKDRPQPKALSVVNVQAEIVRLQKTWKNMPSVHVVKSVKDLPFKTPANTDGAYTEKTVYVVADNIANLKQLQKVMAHECVMHHSLEEMLGDYGFSKLHKGVQQLKKDGDPTIVALSKDIASRYGPLPPVVETKEIIARAGEQCLDDHGQIKVHFGWMKGVFAGVAGFLRDQGLNIPFSNTEIQGIMHNAGEWVKRDYVEPSVGSREFSMFGRQGIGEHAAPMVLNSFAGIRAETAPLDALRIAREMRIQGDEDRAIWEATGWTFAFADGKPRFEISDDKASVVIEGRTAGMIMMDMMKVDSSVHTIGQFIVKHPDSPLTAEINNPAGARPAYAGMVANDPSTAREIEKYLQHDRLFEAYPQLAKLKAAQPAGIEGLVNAGNAAFIADESLIKFSKIANPDQFMSSSLHELQHAVQEIEGFAPGGNPNQFKALDLTDKELKRINEVVTSLHDRNPAFYRDCVQATQLQIKVTDKYGRVNDCVASDPLVQQWWTAIDQRDSHPESSRWFELKSLEHQIARDRVLLSPMDQYSRLAGEVEARLTQARIDMSPQERLQGYPIDDMSVPVASQVVQQAAKQSAVREGSYSGKILDVANGLAIQRINRAGATVAHVLSKLSVPVVIDQVVDVNYGPDGVGVVSGKGVGKDVGVGR